VPKLCRAKPLDNLEFLQWIKRYFDLHYGGHEYNALERRGGKGGAVFKENESSNKPAPKTASMKAGAARVATGASRPTSAVAKTAAPSEFFEGQCVLAPGVPLSFPCVC
jgi:RP/EB family microtubule-associated protein